MRKSNYGNYEKIKNIYMVMKSRLFYRKTRMIRFPVVIRGKKHIDFGKNLTTGYNCRIEVNGIFKRNEKRIILGENINIGDYVRISCCEKIKIGDNVLIGSRVLIIDNTHGEYSLGIQASPLIPPNQRQITKQEIEIKKNVWIGEGVVIQKGVTIGEGSIIAANTVVTKNIEPYTINAGIPSKIIKKYDFEKEKWIKKEV